MTDTVFIVLIFGLTGMTGIAIGALSSLLVVRGRVLQSA